MNSRTGQPVALMIGGSRGIGRQVAIDLAKNGYAVAVAAKTTSDADTCSPFPPDPNSSQSTINTVAREIKEAGGLALAIQMDVRFPEEIQKAVDAVVQHYGHLDAVVYNSGAIWWASVAKSPMKRFQLMQRINPEGLYATVQAVLPHFYNNTGGANGGQGRFIVISPPIYSRFLRGKTAYAMGKWGMSALTMGLAMDFEREERHGLAITSLWPAAAIESAATQRNTGLEALSQLRKPAIFSDAILAILRSPIVDVNGQTLLDEDFLRTHEGVTDFSQYARVSGTEPRRIMPLELPSLRVREHDDEGQRVDSTKLSKAKL